MTTSFLSDLTALWSMRMDGSRRMSESRTANCMSAQHVRNTEMTVTERRAMISKHKKSTPEGAPLTQFKSTPSASKNQQLAEFLLGCIGDRAHPVKRPRNRSVDRILRGLISEKNAAGEDIIINNGDGYYRAGPDDRPAVFDYWVKETHRAKEIKNKADTMMATYTTIYGGYE